MDTNILKEKKTNLLILNFDNLLNNRSSHNTRE